MGLGCNFKLYMWAKREEQAIGMFNGTAIDGEKDLQQIKTSLTHISEYARKKTNWETGFF